MVDAVGVAVLDGELCRGAARRDEEFVVLVGLALVRVNLVGDRLDVRDVSVELEVDVALVVPLRLVDGDGRLGQFALGELLDENPVVEGLSLVGDDGH